MEQRIGGVKPTLWVAEWRQCEWRVPQRASNGAQGVSASFYFGAHHVSFGVVSPQWQFSIRMGRPLEFISPAHKSRSFMEPQLSSFTCVWKGVGEAGEGEGGVRNAAPKRSHLGRA